MNAKRARELDWSKFKSAMPLEPITYPTGKAKEDLIARIRRAFVNAKLRQPDGGTLF